MKMKSGSFLIFASFVVAAITSLPMINHDDTLLMPGLLLSNVLFLAGIVTVFRRVLGKEDKKRLPHAEKDA